LLLYIFHGKWGRYDGCVIDEVIGSKGWREYINITYLFNNNRLPGNSLYENYEINMQSLRTVAESVLNEYNTDIYIATSATNSWSGCQYFDSSDLEIVDPYEIATNIAAFGTFNSALASAVLHLSYDAKKDEYSAEYIYYITDYYNYISPKELLLQDAVGIAKSYELFGMCKGKSTWSQGGKFDDFLVG